MRRSSSGPASGPSRRASGTTDLSASLHAQKMVGLEDASGEPARTPVPYEARSCDTLVGTLEGGTSTVDFEHLTLDAVHRRLGEIDEKVLKLARKRTFALEFGAAASAGKGPPPGSALAPRCALRPEGARFPSQEPAELRDSGRRRALRGVRTQRRDAREVRSAGGRARRRTTPAWFQSLILR